MSIYELINRYRFLSIDYFGLLIATVISEWYWYIGWMQTLPTVIGNRLVIYLIVTRKKLRFVQSLVLADLFVGFFFPRAAFQFWIACKYTLVIKDIAMLSIYSSVSTVRHGSRSLSRHLESPQYISLMTSHRAHGVDSHRMAVPNISLFSVSFITSVSPHPLPLPALLLAPFFARSLTLVPRSLLQNHTETLVTQAILRHIQLTSE